jgi:hypothetical protein
MRRVPSVLGAALALVALTTTSQAADHSDLLRFIPDSANAVMVVDMQALLKSPLGVKEKWASKHQTEMLNGALPINPRIERAVLATQLGATNAADAGVIAVAPIPKGASLEQVAKREKGEIETIGGQDVVASARGAFFTEVAPGIGAVLVPANRQVLSKWLKFAKKNKQPVVSDYLKDAVSWPRNGQILLAVDAEDLFHPRAVKNWLSANKKLDKEQVETAHKLITNLRGIKFMARVTDSIQGELYLDFQEKPDAQQLAVLKTVVIAGLEELGASIEDFSNGKSSIEGRSVIVTAGMSENALRRIVSIIQAPVPSAGMAEETPDAETAANPALAATKRYFRSTQSLITELKDLNKQAYHSGMVIQWYETYARKIDQLPLLDVDAEMLQYGKATAEKLRQLAASLNGQNIQANLIDSYKRTSLYAQGGGYYGSYWTGYGAYGPSVWAQSNAADVATAKSETVAKSRNDRFAVWQSIDDDTAEIRRSMTEKYKTEFRVGG